MSEFTFAALKDFEAFVDESKLLVEARIKSRPVTQDFEWAVAEQGELNALTRLKAAIRDYKSERSKAYHMGKRASKPVVKSTAVNDFARAICFASVK